MLFSLYFLVLLYYEKARSDSGKYDNASCKPPIQRKVG